VRDFVAATVQRAFRALLLRNPRKANYKFILKEMRPLLESRQALAVLETKRFSQVIQPVAMARPQGNRILVLAPHPDDEIFGAGGTLLHALTESGTRAEVKIFYFTDGTMEKDAREQVRAEARQAAEMLGAASEFAGYPPYNIPVAEAAVRLREVVAGFQPDVLFTTYFLDDHDDHRRVNEVLLQAYGETPPPMEVWAFQIYSDTPVNVVVDITDVKEKKEAAIGLYKSVKGNRNWAHYIMARNAANCRYIQSRDKIYAESFLVLQIKDYLGLCKIYFGDDARRTYTNEAYSTHG